MGYKIWFGKYKGESLEEIALGKKVLKGGKQEGYEYFYNVGKGKPKYFGSFQNSPKAMERWNQIYFRLNMFVPDEKYKCHSPECENTPTQISIAGNGEYGFSVSPAYISCDDDYCQSSLAGMNHQSRLYPLGFNTMLNFGWHGTGAKRDQQQIAKVLKDLAGWEGNITEDRATEFIDNLQTR